MAVLTSLSAIALAVLGKVTGDEIKAWLPFLEQKLLAHALSRLPEEQRERYAEEWAADLMEIPGDVAKVFYAFGYLKAAVGIRRAKRHGETRYENRGFDVFASAFIMPAVLLICLVFGILVKISSNGPALFRQRRVGKDGRFFDIFRFRATHMDAAKRLEAKLRSDSAALAEWNTTHRLQRDPRLTPLGALMRHLGVDPLLQLFSVLAGDMSLVGPRPRRPEEIQHMQGRYQRVLSVKPGFISPATMISPLNDFLVEELEADLKYVNDRSLLVDLKVIASHLKRPRCK